MNSYRITYSFNGGPVIEAVHAGRTKRCALQSLYAQIGKSSLITIIDIERVENAV